MQARVLLIYPPSRSQTHDTCPASLTLLGAVLERAGYQVCLLDANAASNRRTTQQIVGFASDLKPDVIGITLLTPLVREAYRLATELRFVGAKLVAGGPHASLVPEEPMANGFDATVIGEGEATIAEAVGALLGQVAKESVAGWVYRAEAGTLHRTPPRPLVAELDALPLPAWHLIDPADYGGPSNQLIYSTLFSSRGCPGKCSYCAGSLFGKRFRFRSASSMVEEISSRHQRYGTSHFHFMDDAMTADRERVFEMCKELQDRALGVTWSMMTRIDFVDEELVAAAHRAGCVQIDFGIESGHPETLKRIRKPHTVQMVRRIIPMVAALGIKPVVFFILGFPWDTLESLGDTQRLMEELSPYVAFHPAVASILIPFPGTDIYQEFRYEYAFSEWWLGEDRSYDAPDPQRHAYFETRLFPRGAVLDANFFRYSPEVRRKICDMFRFMWRHSLRHQNWATRARTRALFEASRGLYALSPTLEHAVFSRLRHAAASLAG
jgi:anaerobic magnesium-protoporphyrin IX monomethyl ester cyclase